MWNGTLLTFHGSIFMDVCDRAITYMYKRAYFVGLFFTVNHSVVKIGPLKKFPAMIIIIVVGTGLY